jgi:dimethylhistidine N-methyltransferase
MQSTAFGFHDLAPTEESFRDAVVAGLSREAKALPCKFFYDARGSALFEQICETPEYYLTRAEIAILERYADDIAKRVGPHCRLIELGSGASIKVRILMRALRMPAAYVPVDISREYLRQAAAQVARDFPHVPVVAVCADYTRPFTLPPLPGPPGKRVGFFPGSTIGNFEPDGVVRFLRHCVELLGRECEMLIGADLKKAPEVLNAAYNDREGINAAFNLNLLVRINRELGGDIDVGRFAHVAFYNAEAGRMELYLQSLIEQTVTIAGRRFGFAVGELVHTENSYKYAIDEFGALAGRAGFAVLHTWTDPEKLFSVHYLRQQ